MQQNYWFSGSNDMPFLKSFHGLVILNIENVLIPKCHLMNDCSCGFWNK